MRKIILLGIAVAAILAGAVGGYRLGAGQWPNWHSILLSWAAEQRSPHASTRPPAEQKVLYWKHPGGEADFSPTPKKTADGRDYVPVYEDQEADFKEAKESKAAKARNANRKFCTTATRWVCPTSPRCPRRTGWGWTTSLSTKARKRTARPSR